MESDQGRKNKVTDFIKSGSAEFDKEVLLDVSEVIDIEEFIKDKPEYLKYLTNPSVTPEGMQMIFRSDCMANILLWYLMGATEGNRETPISTEEVEEMLAEKLKNIDYRLYFEVRSVLNNNFKERHIRGGIATKQKYLKQKEMLNK